MEGYKNPNATYDMLKVKEPLCASIIYILQPDLISLSDSVLFSYRQKVSHYPKNFPTPEHFSL